MSSSVKGFSKLASVMQHNSHFPPSFLVLWLAILDLVVWKVLNQGKISQSDEQMLLVFRFYLSFF